MSHSVAARGEQAAAYAGASHGPRLRTARRDTALQKKVDRPDALRRKLRWASADFDAWFLRGNLLALRALLRRQSARAEIQASLVCKKRLRQLGRFHEAARWRKLRWWGLLWTIASSAAGGAPAFRAVIEADPARNRVQCPRQEQGPVCRARPVFAPLAGAGPAWWKASNLGALQLLFGDFENGEGFEYRRCKANAVARPTWKLSYRWESCSCERGGPVRHLYAVALFPVAGGAGSAGYVHCLPRGACQRVPRCQDRPRRALRPTQVCISSLRVSRRRAWKIALYRARSCLDGEMGGPGSGSHGFKIGIACGIQRVDLARRPAGRVATGRCLISLQKGSHR